jgi:hypothetical protein
MNEYRLELLSALQKFIRRGMEYEALHTAFELEENFVFNLLWNDLKIIASEDVGFAFPLMPVLIDTLYKHYVERKPKQKKIDEFLIEKNEEKDDKKPWLLFLSNAVVCLCRLQKNRSADDLLNVVCLERKSGIGVQIPDFALDKHTIKGRANGKGWKDFFDIGSHLENESGENPWKDKHRKLRNV